LMKCTGTRKHALHCDAAAALLASSLYKLSAGSCSSALQETM
jgi:hypothetical protein